MRELNPVLKIRHSRAALIFPLLLGQIIGAALAWVIYALFNGTHNHPQWPLVVIGLVGGAFSYGLITVFFALKMLDKRFLTIYEDGAALYKPGLKAKILKFPPDVQWEIRGKELHFLNVDTDHELRNIDLPPTLKRISFQRIR